MLREKTVGLGLGLEINVWFRPTSSLEVEIIRAGMGTVDVWLQISY